MSQFGIDPAAETLRSATPSGFSSLNSEDFIRIIFTELANQDPFQPNDSSALLEQMSSIRNIESDIDLMERLEALVFENRLAGAANLIGKQVQGLTMNAERVAGDVVSVLRHDETVMLELSNGWFIPVDNVELIQGGVSAPPPEPAPAP